MVRIFLAICLLAGALEAKTICLNMIVKNESPVIERCLNSCKDFIDSWVIVDTGSTDGTQDIIRRVMKDKPGQLYERPWVDFAHNRNEALQFAQGRADYLLFIDADEQLLFEHPVDKGKLTDPYYCSIVREPTVDSIRMFLVDTVHNWQWVGVLHEGICADGIYVDYRKCLPGLVKLSNTLDGFRSKDPEKYLKDAQVLEKALLKEPDNTRYLFYLAQCYMNGGNRALALKNYEKRAQVQGVEEERWYSAYMVARLHWDLKFPAETITKEFCKVFQERPYRAEPLGYLAYYHLQQGNAALAYALADLACKIPRPNDVAFVENWFYEFGFLGLVGDAAAALGWIDVALDAYNQVLKHPHLPADAQQKIEQQVQLIHKIKQAQ